MSSIALLGVLVGILYFSVTSGFAKQMWHTVTDGDRVRSVKLIVLVAITLLMAHLEYEKIVSLPSALLIFVMLWATINLLAFATRFWIARQQGEQI